MARVDGLAEAAALRFAVLMARLSVSVRPLCRRRGVSSVPLVAGQRSRESVSEFLTAGGDGYLFAIRTYVLRHEDKSGGGPCPRERIITIYSAVVGECRGVGEIYDRAAIQTLTQLDGGLGQLVRRQRVAR